MPARFSPTSVTLIAKLKDADNVALWQVSWKRFWELYHEPVRVVARNCYIYHTNGQEPGSGFLEEAVDRTVESFVRGFDKANGGLRGFDKTKGRLRSYLRMLTNLRVIDLLRKERPIDRPLLGWNDQDEILLPYEQPTESEAWHRQLLATMIEVLHNRIPHRQFECFERVKIKDQSPQSVADDLCMTRAMVDRNVHKAMTALRGIASNPEFQAEFYD